MNFTLKLTFILSVAAAALAAPATGKLPKASKFPDLTNRFIIKLRSSASAKSVRSLVASSNKNLGRSASKIQHEYTIIKGIAGVFAPELIKDLRRHKDVEAVIPDGLVTILGDDDDDTQNGPPSWGLSRVAQRKLDLAQPYVSPGAGGKDVDVYVVDTGVVDTHKDFEGRAKMLKSFVDGEAAVDLNGHGTHCSGTIASKTYGVAKKVNVFGVKVLNAGGSGTWAGVIAGIDFAANYTKGTDNPRVISMSLGGGKNDAVNQAVTNAAAKGVVVLSAAGNSYGADACGFSPAGAPGGLAVGATDKTDALAYYSNKGKCVGILAPGTDITSLWLGADGATNTISGTSMATPHVAGVAALYLSKHRDYANPQEVFDALIAASTKDTIKGLDAATVNRLLFNFRKEN